ncbi:MAG: serine hydrolase [Longimicrobiales bacterium]|nr:serine hydrolase [Longimicrobiales bacterium]
MFHRRMSVWTSAAVAAAALLPSSATLPDSGLAVLSAQDATEPAAPRGPTDPAELEAFLAGLMGAALVENHTAGGVVAVVSGGRIFFAKGYGYSDWEARTPVDPETTLFRIGSVSKLFVWTSVMQMVEAGLLDLDTDVNEYLDFEIPATFQEPVTLAAIMAHAGGFEDYVIELFGNEPEDVRPLGELVSKQLPARVRPAGRQIRQVPLSRYLGPCGGGPGAEQDRRVGPDFVYKPLLGDRAPPPRGVFARIRSPESFGVSV